MNLLTEEEKTSKPEIISLTEQVLDAEGIECDSKIAKLPEEKIKKILTEVRKRRRRKGIQYENLEEDEEEEELENPVSAK